MAEGFLESRRGYLTRHLHHRKPQLQHCWVHLTLVCECLKVSCYIYCEKLRQSRFTRASQERHSGKHIESSIKNTFNTFAEKMPLRLEKHFQGDVTKRGVPLYDVTLAKLIIHYIELLIKNSTSAFIGLILGTVLYSIPFHSISCVNIPPNPRQLRHPACCLTPPDCCCIQRIVKSCRNKSHAAQV